VEEQVKTLVLINIRSKYVFKIIDPAVVSEMKIKPKRAVVCNGGFFFGLIFSVILCLPLSAIKRMKTNGQLTILVDQRKVFK
jgi:hypothetical protein